MIDPRIGQLQTAEGIVYYAFVDGHGKPEFRSKNLADVELALKRKKVPVAQKKERVLRTYIVTVTPKIKSYAGTWSSGEYKVEVNAYDRNEAIRMVRQEHNFREGSMSGGATYHAKLKK